MTQNVRSAYRRHRRGTAGVVALLALAAGLVFAVLPAGAANAPSGQGVTPTVVTLGGQSADCAAVASTGAREFRVVNPQDGQTYTDPATGATFALTVDTDQIFLGFTITGALAYDVVIKGGTKSTHYDYAAATVGAVPSDTLLHAPPKGNTYFAVSHITFCYSTGATISGTVFHDLNGNGVKDTGASNTPVEVAQAGWTVKLYSSTASLIATATTLANGTYSFANVPLGQQYTVCESAPSTDPWVQSGGSWGQSVPTTTPTACATGSQEPRGWQLTVSSNAAKDFGNVQTKTIGCGGSASTTGYSVQLGNDAASNVSTANCDKTAAQEYVIETWTVGSQFFFKFVPYPAPASAAEVLLVEKLTSTFDASLGQTSKLLYDDDESDGLNFVDVPYCKLDPRDPNVVGGLTLGPNVASGAVLPAGATSCLIESTQVADPTTANKVNRLDFVFSTVDGFRTSPG